MPKKSERLTALPAGLVPLLTMPQIETYYGVSDWQILQWIKQGMPVAPFAGRQRRFDLAAVQEWMAEQDAEASEQLVAASA
ncbi:phage transcriptional regulator AlpA [Streptomyces sp. CBMAI 2042]|uniref:helix-turn-helix transcriptional regulator n=1 Tax=Streptomyces sp. CBMAI 2042 TaxID=2305222 RepID=UPI000F217579|nr:terminase small subunit [Streptomyces sp. CBMAI 2042]RLV66296.1 phage transcriptional regulator AlpA [Streptomyces sp. CBMAI 2042]